ncbi:hypothetical protein AB0H83_33020 [Dactylosporangium sp. NPDC050688]|uniref:hypothetical protein n=1 Tax=Dactylosporangium sp. NPDC050688 TaxID=3157217 RepID=UPI0033EFD07D
MPTAAASGSVRRVVLTSSIDAIRLGHDSTGTVGTRTFTEDDWSDVTRADPYPKSKVLAERAAWQFVRGTALELVAVHPGLVLGPLQRAARTTSAEPVRLLLSRGVPAVPHLGFAVVDVRDVARAHRLATESAAAAGNRYILAGEHRWLGEIAAVLAERFRPLGYRVPTRRMPRPLMWTAARFDRTLRLALAYVGRPALVSADKAARELGWTARPADESIVDMAESLIAHGIVAPRVRRAGAPRVVSPVPRSQ